MKPVLQGGEPTNRVRRLVAAAARFRREGSDQIRSGPKSRPSTTVVRPPDPYDVTVNSFPPPASPAAGSTSGDEWLGLLSAPLPVDDVSRWVVRPDCGAVVVFTGVVRDHADGRTDVTELTYEAYEEYAVARLGDVVTEARRKFTTLGRIALLHRVGRLELGEAAVVVAVSAPHRDEAFAAARFGIDTVKAVVPIWKHERWAGGEGWGTNASPLHHHQFAQHHDGRPQAPADPGSGPTP